jgi:hypothetical protein
VLGCSVVFHEFGDGFQPELAGDLDECGNQSL